ncbi:4-hydroxythreonine-4-phosphate dehydrogenase 1 [Chromobacterium violaceum]|uniref:4-hydroxythreonine-4-phosphate dehydrogenase 1 n=1 Tax=Chromobacterium violaceum TaxID=536 RepID=A0AAX2MDW8_CHRVL|nr:4-hydroxythreonine-4-phosphate dehydrogenase 1 [Chromobacterium violaceum]
MMPKRPVLAVTAGEPAGIGPDLVLRLPELAPEVRCVAIADRALLADRAAALGLDVRLADYRRDRPAPAGALEVLHVPLAARRKPAGWIRPMAATCSPRWTRR